MLPSGMLIRAGNAMPKRITTRLSVKVKTVARAESQARKETSDKATTAGNTTPDASRRAAEPVAPSWRAAMRCQLPISPK